jgi:hypothetical protein
MAAPASSPFECPVDLCDFVDPVTAPCGHTLCRACYVAWVASAGGSAACPSCRAPLPREPPAISIIIRGAQAAAAAQRSPAPALAGGAEQAQRRQFGAPVAAQGWRRQAGPGTAWERQEAQQLAMMQELQQQQQALLQWQQLRQEQQMLQGLKQEFFQAQGQHWRGVPATALQAQQLQQHQLQYQQQAQLGGHFTGAGVDPRFRPHQPSAGLLGGGVLGMGVTGFVAGMGVQGLPLPLLLQRQQMHGGGYFGGMGMQGTQPPPLQQGSAGFSMQPQPQVQQLPPWGPQGQQAQMEVLQQQMQQMQLQLQAQAQAQGGGQQYGGAAGVPAFGGSQQQGFVGLGSEGWPHGGGEGVVGGGGGEVGSSMQQQQQQQEFQQQQFQQQYQQQQQQQYQHQQHQQQYHQQQQQQHQQQHQQHQQLLQQQMQRVMQGLDPFGQQPQRHSAFAAAVAAAPFFTGFSASAPGASAVSVPDAAPANDRATVRNLLSEQLFHKVRAILGATPHSPGVTSGKIMGMLLEQDTKVIIGMLEDSAALERKIGEAREVLRAAKAAHEAQRVAPAQGAPAGGSGGAGAASSQ